MKKALMFVLSLIAVGREGLLGHMAHMRMRTG